MGIEAIAIGAFLFVALAVAGCRAVDAFDVARRGKVRRRELVSRTYTGPLYNRHGRELGE